MPNIAYLAYPFLVPLGKNNDNFCRTFFVSHKRVETWKTAKVLTDVKSKKGALFFQYGKISIQADIVCLLIWKKLTDIKKHP